MINTSNLCIFEGRVAKDPQFSQVNGQNGPIEKVVFDLAVDRGLSAAQKQNAQVTADFIHCAMIGNQVNAFRQYCPKGKAIKVVCRYEQYQYQDKQTGQTQYGHQFQVDNFGFTTADAKNMAQGGGNASGGFQQNNGYQNNGYQQNNNYQQGGYQQQPQQNNFMNAPAPQQMGNFEMFEQSNSASPF